MNSKIFSARFWMAIIMTVSGCVLAYFDRLTSEYMAIWGVVVAHYFGRNDRGDKHPKDTV
jgi:hypothetical protein